MSTRFLRGVLAAAILGLCCAPEARASYRQRDDVKARMLADQAAVLTGAQGWCYFYVLKALKAVGLLPPRYWKDIATDSAYKFGFARRRANLPARFPLKMVPSYAPWKEGTIVVWNRDDGRHSCGRDTSLGRKHGHIEIVVDPRRVGRASRYGSYLACSGTCGYTSVKKVNSYLRKGCVRVYEPALWVSL